MSLEDKKRQAGRGRRFAHQNPVIVQKEAGRGRQLAHQNPVLVLRGLSMCPG